MSANNLPVSAVLPTPANAVLAYLAGAISVDELLLVADACAWETGDATLQADIRLVAAVSTHPGVGHLIVILVLDGICRQLV